MSQIDEQLKSDCKLKLKLERLEQICKETGLSDLHGENVRFVNLKVEQDTIKGCLKFSRIDNNKDIDIVLIDLENLQQGKASGLFSDKPILPELNENEKKHIAEFITNIQPNMYHRFAPLSTIEFRQALSDPDKISKVVDRINSTCSDLGYRLNSNQELEGYITKCFLNGDIPFFLCKNNTVYFGGHE